MEEAGGEKCVTFVGKENKLGAIVKVGHSNYEKIRSQSKYDDETFPFLDVHNICLVSIYFSISCDSLCLRAFDLYLRVIRRLRQERHLYWKCLCQQ